MDFKQTSLWKTAFEERRRDTTREEQARLAACYEAMRERASALVRKIAVDLPHMTIHDVTHLDALWEMAAIACGTAVELNPAEAFVFGGAVLFHDAAMSLAAFPGGVAELKRTIEWRDLYARYSGLSSAQDTAAVKIIENRATEDALRLLHAEQAENLPKVSWLGPHGQAMFVIEDQQVRNFYGPKIGKVAYSHWWSISKVEEELAGTLGALAGVTNCTVDLLKVSCLLRVADVMHLDQRRAPAFEFALTQPEDISADHWKFQGRMAKPFVKGDALVYTAQPPFEVDVADAWWTAFDALQVVDRELRNVDRVLRERRDKALVVRRVDGAHSPSDLATTVETVGWVPVDSTVRVTDVPKIIATLGGNKLYGSDATAPIRELIQNGLDSITARRRLQSRPTNWGELQVILEKREDGNWLCVEDNGVGMSTVVLTGSLIDFGNSFWRSSLALQEFPGLASTGMKARGRYGIGFFSVFMLGDHVRVITRRYDREIRSARVLEFRYGLGSRPNLREAASNEVPLDGGTRVEVKLRINPAEPGGLLREEDWLEDKVRQLDSLVAEIAPATDVDIRVVQDGQTIGSTRASDWLEIGTAALLTRITGGNSVEKSGSRQELVELRDESGRIYGRARIDADSSTWRPYGVITVDGLMASRIGWLAGILVGVETTVSRNSANPIVPAPVIAAWASKQALIYEHAEMPDEKKAEIAEIIAILGGNVAGLPLVHWKGEWMSAAQISAAVMDLDCFLVHEGKITHDDDDDVTRWQFEHYFSKSPEIARSISRGIGGGDWMKDVMGNQGVTPLKIIESILVRAWSASDNSTVVEKGKSQDSVVVGEVDQLEIRRLVTVFTRVKVEPTTT